MPVNHDQRGFPPNQVGVTSMMQKKITIINPSFSASHRISLGNTEF
ncbi:hypothetical protein LYNGBM3L_62460 [Moorena producens 3L]|uniref:Uncharacterized protein n=1 Tax=Moorena producens 3L TaxID=489825 RepID=F4Y157_9CYAN|nr:hypothetical protein [Moorena producens 3L]EGJ29568.1 hypothetical protein LYNGBM3L_62460 [Moorena producens 3L]